MTDTQSQPASSLPDDVLSHDMWLLQLNIEAGVRCSKDRTPTVVAYHANVCAATWAAHRAFRLLAELAPDRASALVEELEGELEDGEYMEYADELAYAAGVEVGELADRVRAEYASAAPTA